ncbi:unnamed protein product [Meganyctiphanes norvegica]|uniref:Uncharacterized protein n=1 Tax=Meganyctiphanes norvegica TaxID=48144 RepID=A0AAV2Q553_MEGNR
MSEYEDVESDEEETYYGSYRYNTSTSHSLSNEEEAINASGDDYSLESERSDIVEEDIQELIEEEESEGNVSKLQFPSSDGYYEHFIKSEVYPSFVKEKSHASVIDAAEDEQVILDDTTSIDKLSLYGLDYKDDDPDFTNHIESDILKEEFCSHNSVCDPGFHEHDYDNYFVTSPTEIRKMSNSFRVTISPSTENSESHSNHTFNYPHSTQLNNTYLMEPTDNLMFDDGSTDGKSESFESTDVKEIQENTNINKITHPSLYDTCDSAISLSFIRKFSERNENGTNEISRSSSLLESGRDSASLGDTWGSSNLSYPRCRSDSSGNVSDVEMNHLSTTFTKIDLASALDSVLKKRQGGRVDNRETSKAFVQEYGKIRSCNDGSPYHNNVLKSEIPQGSCAWKALNNIYHEDSEV